MKVELRKSVARAYLVFASIFVAGMIAAFVQVLYYGVWDWKLLMATPIMGFYMGVYAVMYGGFLLFPLALAFFLARAWWRRKKDGHRARRGDGPVGP